MRRSNLFERALSASADRIQERTESLRDSIERLKVSTANLRSSTERLRKLGDHLKRDDELDAKQSA